MVNIAEGSWMSLWRNHFMFPPAMECPSHFQHIIIVCFCFNWRLFRFSGNNCYASQLQRHGFNPGFWCCLCRVYTFSQSVLFWVGETKGWAAALLFSPQEWSPSFYLRVLILFLTQFLASCIVSAEQNSRSNTTFSNQVHCSLQYSKANSTTKDSQQFQLGTFII